RKGLETARLRTRRSVRHLVLANGISTASDPDVLASCDLACPRQGALDPVVHEVKSGTARALPRLTDLMREDEHPRGERCLLRPGWFAVAEHPLTHDADPGPIKGLLGDLVVSTRLPAFPQVEVLAEEPLGEDPCLEIEPATHPVLVARVLCVLEVHPIGGDKA